MKWGLIFHMFICGMCLMKDPVVYRAKENQNVTIVWSTPMKTDFNLINMICEFHAKRVKIVYETTAGSAGPVDEQFAARVRFDREAPRKAEIRLHLSRVKEEDSGEYFCFLNANYDSATRRWRLQMTESFVLNVTSGENSPSSNTPGCSATPDAEQPPSGPDQRIRLAISLSVFGAFVVLMVFILSFKAPVQR